MRWIKKDFGVVAMWSTANQVNVFSTHGRYLARESGRSTEVGQCQAEDDSLSWACRGYGVEGERCRTINGNGICRSLSRKNSMVCVCKDR